MLSLKHWQVFLILIIGISVNNFNIINNQELTLALTIIGFCLYSSWIVFAGFGLYQLLPSKIKFNYNLYIINTIVFFVFYIFVLVISNGQGMSFSGPLGIIGIYIFYALLQISMFPVQVLNTIESGKKAKLGDCIGDFFLVVFLPIGIWFLQPRINKVYEMRNDKVND